ncbi:MAG: ParB/RepB/Spo0J family partition protein [Thermodesulfobacteriota bacterium]
MAIQRGLGRGLDALLSGFGEDMATPDVLYVPVEDIRPNPNQPRRDFDQAALEELAESIRESGVLQPILLRSMTGGEARYELVAGERRWRASQLAGKSDIPAIVREMTDDQSLAIALVENLQREDLNPIEEAVGFGQLQERFGLTQEDLARRLGKSRPAIANTLRLLQLPEPMQIDIRSGRLSAGHGRALLAVVEEAAREDLWRTLLERNLSVREAEAMAVHWKDHGAFPETVAAPAKAPSRQRASRQHDPELADLRERLAALLGLAVGCKGSLDKGQIVLGFASRQELARLLERLGLDLGLADQES